MSEIGTMFLYWLNAGIDENIKTVFDQKIYSVVMAFNRNDINKLAYLFDLLEYFHTNQISMDFYTMSDKLQLSKDRLTFTYVTFLRQSVRDKGLHIYGRVDVATDIYNKSLNPNLNLEQYLERPAIFTLQYDHFCSLQN